MTDQRGDKEQPAERWARETPTSTLRWVATEAREFSDVDRVAAADAEIARRRTEER